MDRLLNVMAVFSILLIAWVLTSVRRAHIRVEYSVSWLAAGIVLLVMSRSSSTLSWIAGVTGINDGPLALVAAVFCVFLVLFYAFSIRISDLKDANVALTQRVAILEYHIRGNEEQQETGGR